MARLRLNKDSRAVLRGLVEDKVTADPKFNEDADNASALHSKLALEFDAIVYSIAAARYPAADIAVLRKYSLTDTLSSVYVTTGGREVYDEHRFLHGVEIEVPERHNYGSRNPPILLNQEQADLYNRMKAAERESRDAISLQKADLAKRREAYYQLIDNARFFEDVVAVWSEAAEVGDQIRPEGTAVAIISETVKAAIAADMQRRNVAA